MIRIHTLLALAAALCVATAARAQHSDIEVTVENGRLVVAASAEGLVFEGELGETIPNFGNEPGFEAEDGVLQAADEIGFHLVAGLLFWDGAQFTATPNDELLTISKAVFSTVVTSNSGPQHGFIFATADDEGGMHEDLEFLLARPDADPATAVGAYGLWLQLHSPSYESSNSFIILLNNGLDEAEFEAGVAAAASLVPEPSASVLLLLGCCISPILYRFARRGGHALDRDTQ